MAKKLMIIESPNKIETIKKYLHDKDFEIIATIGHIRDLPKNNAHAFDPKTFEPHWIISHNKKGAVTERTIIDSIKKAAKEADKIYLATDPDREGEAIAWHVYEILNDSCKKKVKRVTFNEITEHAIEESFEHERDLDINWVHSQFVRRLIDRIVGYDLSKFVRKSVQGASSAGRVQSVVLRFIYDRIKEIEKFKPSQWWTIESVLKVNDNLKLVELKPDFKKTVEIADNEEIKTSNVINFAKKEEAENVKELLSNKFTVEKINEPEQRKTKARVPYKTSTLQQDAINSLGWSISKVSFVSQELYEGVKTGKSTVGLITYPRTDSVVISDSFVLKAKDFIIKTYGEKYFNENYAKVIVDKKKNVQAAHECIRVVDPYITPESVKSVVSKDQFKLYNMIWLRTIGALMTPSIYEYKKVIFDNNAFKFQTTQAKMIFEGFKILKISDDEEEKHIHDYKVGQSYDASSITVLDHVTKAPPYFNQASLIKALDEAGIGRPSTYKLMTTITVLRGYCEIDSKQFHITEIGEKVINTLISNFGYIIEVGFTRDMENTLDNIAEAKEPWDKWLGEFTPKFKEKVEKMMKDVKKEENFIGRNCPKCGKPLLERYSPKTKSKFIGCSGFPKCNYAEFPKQQVEEIKDRKCPECGSTLLIKHNHRGQKFIACSNYPNCKHVESLHAKPADKPQEDKKPA